jgi:hypothetical protein
MTMIIIQRKDALDQGLSYFFTGKPCKNNHIAERVTKTYRCIECKREWEKEWRDKNPEKDKAMRAREVRKNADEYKRRHNEYVERKGEQYIYDIRKAWKQNNKGRVNEGVRRRQVTKLQATPPWFELEKCQALYDDCARLTNETGTEHHVDHIVPIINETVCGLHCFNNLQILTAVENMKKGSNFKS